MKRFLSSKTTWVSVAGIASAVAAYHGGEITVGTAIMIALNAALGSTVRDTLKAGFESLKA